MLKIKNNELLHYAVEESSFYKEQYDLQVQQFWTRNNVDVSKDIADYKTQDEIGQEIIKEVFKIFTNSDVNVATTYSVLSANHINSTEINMALAACNYIETVHQDSYSQLVDTLGFSNEFHEEFLDNPIYVKTFNMLINSRPGLRISYENDQDYIEDLIRYIFLTSAMTEGILLMSQFSILLMFGRNGKYSAMTDINTYSVSDEEIHITILSKLTRDIVAKYLGKLSDKFLEELEDISDTFVELQYQITDEIIPENGYILSKDSILNREDHKRYISFLQKYRMYQFLDYDYPNEKNPYSWLESMISNTLYTDFFSSQVTGYALGTNKETGTWEELRRQRAIELENKDI